MPKNSGPGSRPGDGGAQEQPRAGGRGGVGRGENRGDDSQAVDQNAGMPNAQTKPKRRSKFKPRTKRKLTDLVQARICGMICVGCSIRTAARLNGCSEGAIRHLARRDDAFDNCLRDATIQREIVPLRNIINASQNRWRAGAWLLERLNPEEYGYRKPETVTPRILGLMIEELAGSIAEAVTDPATRQRILDVIDRLMPKADRTDEMQTTKMPEPFDADSDLDDPTRGRRRG